MKLIGLSGTNGSGKDTVGHLLQERHDWLFVSMTDMLREEARKRNLGVDREVLRTISAEWRRAEGLGVLVDKSVTYYEAQEKQYQGLVVASLRNPGEADRIHELGGQVIWVDADPRTRYDRIQRNAARRDRAEEDNRTYEQFLADEAAEMSSTGDAATLRMAEVKKRADLFLTNERADMELLATELENVLHKAGL